MSKLEHVQTFTDVVRCGGFSAAARSRGIPRSTVSLHVKTLEEALGTRLFKRSTRDVTLTEDGRALFDRVDRNISDLSASLAAFREPSRESEGLIRATAPADFPSQVLAGAIAGFMDLHPGVRFELLLTNSTVGLIQENIDIAIGFAQRTDGGRIKRDVIPIQWKFYASGAWLAANDPPASIAEIRQFISPAAETRNMLEKRILGGVKLPRGSIQANSHLLIRDLVLQNLGVGLLPEGLVEAIDSGENAQPLNTIEPHAPLCLSLEFPSRADILPRVRLFADYFIDHFRATA